MRTEDFVKHIKSLGFRVFLASKGDYGFITDDSETRVLSFSMREGGSLSGNYYPASRESGTGWRLAESIYSLETADNVRRALYATPPRFCGNGWKSYATVKQHLETYQQSSNYREIF